MTREEAYGIDKGHGAYSDCGESPDGQFRVWGAKSGFCYGAYADIAEASDEGCALHEELAVAHCECGEITGVRCEWHGPHSETVKVRWMREWLRGSHRAAGYSTITGFGSAAGVETLTLERSCANSLSEPNEDDNKWWIEVVEA